MKTLSTAFVGLLFSTASLADNLSNGVVALKENRFEKAATFFQSSCDEKNMTGCANLGMLYKEGKGVERNHAKAQELFKKVCDAGLGDGCVNFAEMCNKEEKPSVGCEPKIAMLEKACNSKQRYAKGCYILSFFYQEGQGVKRDHGKAAELNQRACDADLGVACVNLGFAYQHGRGVTQNHPYALNSYQKACNLGVARGCNNLGDLYKDGKGAAQNFAKAVELFNAACHSKQEPDHHSCYSLGKLYFKGEGVEKNTQNALKLFDRACKLGNKNGCESLKSSGTNWTYHAFMAR